MTISLKNISLIALGLVVLITTGRLAVSAGTPNLWSPYPLFQFFILAGGWPQWVCSVAAFSMFMAFYGACRRSQQLYAGVVLAALTLLTIAYFAVYLSAGMRHQGPLYVFLLAIFNTLALGLLWWLWKAFSWPPSGLKAFIMALSLSSWLFWFAFPYLGEGI